MESEMQILHFNLCGAEYQSFGYKGFHIAFELETRMWCSLQYKQQVFYQLYKSMYFYYTKK